MEKKEVIVSHTEAFSKDTYVHIYTAVDSVRFKMTRIDDSENAILQVNVLVDGKYQVVYEGVVNREDEDDLVEIVEYLIKETTVYGKYAKKWGSIASRLITGHDI